ncbi:esterase B1-like isoform X1 [Ptiloglossa arizonensis]|uniref:esterase B1-like isoform X1 n=1 Tax=Ptiloglossa arizonensis TaxID=3350558 RepID=UPI003F9F5D55
MRNSCYFRIRYPGYINTELYGPDFFMEQNVTIVSMNYRLGTLGFLYLNNTNVMGNAAPKDQVLTMKWMQDNIVAFGGDPKRVTLFNVSAGVSTVPLHLVPIDRKSKWITVISSVLHASP